MSARSVVVVMPFGGKDRTERRRAILNFKRLEYLLRSDKCNVTSISPTGEHDRVVYAVEVAKTAMDDIPEKALQQIEAADILIAVVVERNPNVIYEVAYRRARDRTVVLVVDSADNLPLYLTSLAYQTWKQAEVLERINQIANDSFRELSDFSVGIPDDLKRAIDIYDGELQKGLNDALQEIEAKFEPHLTEAVQHFRGIVSDKISSFYPSSIVEIPFSARGVFANPQHPAIVRDFDDGFSRLYGYVDKRQADADRPLVLDKLVGRIKSFSDENHWAEFMQEQIHLTTVVIMGYGFARATVPLRINDTHPRGEYQGKSYLPCIVGEVLDGSLDGPHKMYLLVVYIELPETVSPVRSAP
jgi:hypothetical protein